MAFLCLFFLHHWTFKDERACRSETPLSRDRLHPPRLPSLRGSLVWSNVESILTMVCVEIPSSSQPYKVPSHTIQLALALLNEAWARIFMPFFLSLCY